MIGPTCGSNNGCCRAIKFMTVKGAWVSVEDFTDPRRAGMGECFIPDDSDRGLLSAD
jgi:hypothetical protein